jgi:peptidoglycan-N-acetylglucosamine deacetylase
MKSKFSTRFLSIIMSFCVALTATTAHGQKVPQRTIAITIDDLPLSGIGIGNGCDEHRLETFNRRLLQSISDARVRVTGFINEGIVCDSMRSQLLPKILSAWLVQGHGLGNHGFSHLDLNTAGVEQYTQDIERGAVALKQLVPHGPYYFRHPMLHTGPTTEKRQALERYLAANDYIIAPVTIDNQEWVFARLYQLAVDRHDRAIQDKVKAAYVAYMESVVAFFEERSRETMGREPAQILLLHANELNVEMLPVLTVMLRQRGYAIVALSEALSDPAYASSDGYTGPRGLSWIHRWGLPRGFAVAEEPREPEWVNEKLMDYR